MATPFPRSIDDDASVLSENRTDEFSCHIVEDPVHIRDFQATLLHLFGIDHQRFTYNLQGLNAKPTGNPAMLLVAGPLLN